MRKYAKNAEFETILRLAVVSPSFAHIKGLYMSDTSLLTTEPVSNYIFFFLIQATTKLNSVTRRLPQKKTNLRVEPEEGYITTGVAGGRGDGCKQKTGLSGGEAKGKDVGVEEQIHGQASLRSQSLTNKGVEGEV